MCAHSGQIWNFDLQKHQIKTHIDYVLEIQNTCYVELHKHSSLKPCVNKAAREPHLIVSAYLDMKIK